MEISNLMLRIWKYTVLSQNDPPSKKKKKIGGGVKYKSKKPKIDQQSRGFKKQNKNILTFLPWN